MKVLVTGGGGFLGGAVVRQLLDDGDEVSIFNRSEAPELASLGVRCLRGDLADAGAVDRACAGADALIHVGARAGPGLRRVDFERPNVDGTRHVIEACRRRGVGVLVHTSSPSVVHSGRDLEGVNEALPYPEAHPAPYPATKTAAERMVLAADEASLRTVALRPHLVWGPGDNHLLPRLVERNRAGRLRLPAPDKLIDTTYIDNAARAHVLALRELSARQRCAGKAYFISNGEPRPVGEIIQMLLLAAGEVPRIRRVPPAVARAAAAVVDPLWRLLRLRRDPPVSRFLVEHLATAHWFDISAAERDFGYRPEVSIDEGLKRLAAAWRANG
jgi:nucleoside-diphosphate-sugar epimerase